MARPVFDADIVEHLRRLPQRIKRDRGHDRGADQKQDAERLIGVLLLQQTAELAADQQRADGGNRQEYVPHRADLAGHRMLLADHRRQPVLGAGDEQERSRQHNDREEERRIAHRRERKQDVEQGSDAAKQQHESAISHPERIPDIAHESEYEREVERDRGDKPESGDLMRGQMQPVLEKEADGNIDQASSRPAEGQQDNQNAEIEKNAVPLRGRQIGGRGGDSRCGGCRTVNRHRGRSVPRGEQG